jgi:addiction module HigA family antidote
MLAYTFKFRLCKAFLFWYLFSFAQISLNVGMKRLKNIHPGEILSEEFLKPKNLSVSRLSKDTGISRTRISNIVKRESGITSAVALKLSAYFGNSVKFWLGLQKDYEQTQLSKRGKAILKEIKAGRFQKI